MSKKSCKFYQKVLFNFMLKIEGEGCRDFSVSLTKGRKEEPISLSVQLYRMLKSDKYWAALAAIVDNLLPHEVLEGEQVEEIVAAWLH